MTRASKRRERLPCDQYCFAALHSPRPAPRAAGQVGESVAVVVAARAGLAAVASGERYLATAMVMVVRYLVVLVHGQLGGTKRRVFACQLGMSNEHVMSGWLSGVTRVSFHIRIPHRLYFFMKAPTRTRRRMAIGSWRLHALRGARGLSGLNGGPSFAGALLMPRLWALCAWCPPPRLCDGRTSPQSSDLCPGALRPYLAPALEKLWRAPSAALPTRDHHHHHHLHDHQPLTVFPPLLPVNALTSSGLR